MAGRFIKLYDKILQWEWFGHPNTVCLFIYLLLKANYKDARFQGNVIRRGQLVTSLSKIATDVGLSIRQTRTSLEHLKSTGEVTDESTSQYRIITVVKYDDYQTSTSEATSNRQATDKRSDKRPTSESTTSIEYIEQIEDIEKIESPTVIERKTAKRFIPPTLEEVTAYCQERGNGVNPQRFIDFYESKGWKIGKETMKDWKASVRTWENRDKQNNRPSAPAKVLPAQNFEQRDYSSVDDELMDQIAREMATFKATGEV